MLNQGFYRLFIWEKNTYTISNAIITHDPSVVKWLFTLSKRVPVNPVSQFQYQYGIIVWVKNGVDPDQLASDKASLSVSTLYSKEGKEF